MRFACLLLASALICLAAAASGRPAGAFEIRSYITGEKLYKVCASDRDSCYTYIYGVLDTVMLDDDANKQCTFDPEGVAGDKAVNAVTSYLKEHQDRWDWSAAALVQNTVRSKFPCKKKKE